MHSHNRVRSIVAACAVVLTVSLVAPSAGAQTVPAAEPVVYVVRSGDTAWAIADRFSISLTDLVRVNRLGAEGIVRVGQKLVIPKSPFNVPPRLPSELRTAAKLALIPHFQAAATATGVPSDLLMAVAYTESSWRTGVISPDGAVGLAQLLPTTARWVATNLAGNPKLSEKNDRDNLLMSALYLRWLLAKFKGDRRLALSSYFEGFVYVQKNGPSRAGKRYASTILLRVPLFAAA